MRVGGVAIVMMAEVVATVVVTVHAAHGAPEALLCVTGGKPCSQRPPLPPATAGVDR
jgi:hypothetical protein